MSACRPGIIGKSRNATWAKVMGLRIGNSRIFVAVARGQVFLMPRPVGFTRSGPAGGTTMARTPSDNSEIRHSLDE
jgi:hypothetical protein